MEERFIGLILAILSSGLIGSSFVITKMGLNQAAKRNGGSATENHGYLNNGLWWAGMITMILGEVANFAAYSFAPAILVTPLGAGSVFIGAIMAQIFLGERLGVQGSIGCALCIIGSIVIILHSPEEKEIDSVEQILNYAVHPAFLFYVVVVVSISLYLMYKVAPIYGKKNMLVYISICSLIGSICVMSAKGFGIALKLTFSGKNQLKFVSTYVFAIIVVTCAMTQINYFNKALEQFSTNRVTPIYYVFFTTATILASIILFQGFNNTTTIEVITALCGFFTIFIGVFLVNSAKGNQSADMLPVNTSPGEKIGSRRTSMNLRRNTNNTQDNQHHNNEMHLLRTFDSADFLDEEDEEI